MSLTRCLEPIPNMDTLKERIMDATSSCASTVHETKTPDERKPVGRSDLGAPDIYLGIIKDTSFIKTAEYRG
ncbi:unnamed protein product [Larinioides sclopetarius]|uniref:Uncharacterized protein n=1 Tax=Larinioides sclopetarius TaxID=280406 RepID=A0AAV1YX63_9ARAC